MPPIFNNMSEAIGRTPLVKAEKIIKSQASVLLKMECLNPLSSVKDRIGLAMIEAGERDLKITPHTTIIEPTSGNTGIALAFVCAQRGYQCMLTMPESMSLERRKVLVGLGAHLVLTPAKEGMPGAIARAQQLLATTSNSYMPQQFQNPANPEIHRKTTAVEIWEDTKGAVDIFISGVGTGGTITGVGELLKEKKPSVQIIAVEPSNSPVLTQAKAGQTLIPGPHKIQGIGAGFIPDILNLEIIDEVIKVDDKDAVTWARRAATEEGLFVGISSGAALQATFEVASRKENAGKTIVAVMPSFAERYLSSILFEGLAD